MPFKKVPTMRRNSQSILVMTTLPMRTQIQRLADKQGISLSEFGRRAMAEAVAKSTEEVGAE